MNTKDRQRLSRIHAAIKAVPGANTGDGTKTATAVGFVAFHRDMTTIRNACGEAMYLMLCPDPDKTPEEQDAEFESALKTAEDFIKTRQGEDWRNYSVFG